MINGAELAVAERAIMATMRARRSSGLSRETSEAARAYATAAIYALDRMREASCTFCYDGAIRIGNAAAWIDPNAPAEASECPRCGRAQ